MRTRPPLEKSEVRYRPLRDVAPTPHLSIDRAGRILELNRAAAELLGLERTRIGRVRLAARIAPTDADEFHRRRREALDSGELCSFEVEITAPGRPAIPVLMTLLPLPKSRSRKAACRCTLADLSERRAYQQKLRRMAFDSMLQERRARRRIAGDVHDRLGQALAVAHMKLATVRMTASGDVRTAIDDALRLLQRTLVETRSLTFEISPPILYDLGLVAALRWLAEEMGRQHGLRVEIAADGVVPKLPDDMAAVLFGCSRELLVNVAKHAAVARASVDVRATERQLRLEVRDEGRGFEPDAEAAGFGLFGVREQVRQLGGAFEVDSSPARGTCARIVVRLEGAPERPAFEREGP